MEGHGASASQKGKSLGVDYDALADAISEEEIRRDIEHLSSFTSRALGYEGSDKATEYIVKRLEGLGYSPRQETFHDVMPIDHGGSVDCDALDESIPVHAFWPNLARTPSTKEEGLSGELVYGRNGEYKWYDGREVDGSIVILDFNSTNNYLKAFMLGARAVIFLEPDSPERKEAETKLIAVPLYAPKYYVQKEHIPKLLALEKERARVTIYCRMAWERVTGTNIIAEVAGSEAGLGSDGAVLTTYFDAMSVVPALCPGADQACGLAIWLQMAELLKQHQPARPVTLLATNGHFMNNVGVKSFLRHHPRSESDLKRKFYKSILREGRKWVKEQRKAWRLEPEDILDWPRFCTTLASQEQEEASSLPGALIGVVTNLARSLEWTGLWADLDLRLRLGTPSPRHRIWELLSDEARDVVEAAAQAEEIDDDLQSDIVSGLNEVLTKWDFYDQQSFAAVVLPDEAKELLSRGLVNLAGKEVEKLNRLLLEASFPDDMEKGAEAALWPPAISSYKNGSPLLNTADVLDWPSLGAHLLAEGGKEKPSPARRIWELLPEEQRQAIEEAAQGIRLEDNRKGAAVKALNEVLKSRELYQEEAFAGVKLPEEAQTLLAGDRAKLSDRQVQRLNRLLLNACYPEQLTAIDETVDYHNRRFAICLDLSSRSTRAGVFVNGVRGLDEVNQLRVVMPINNALREHADAAFGKESAKLFYSGISGSQGVTWDCMLPCDLTFDSRPFLDLRREAVAVATTLDVRLAVDTPLDRMELVDVASLTEQGRAIAAVVGGLMRDKRRLPKKKISLIEFLDYARTRALYLDPKKMTYTGIAEQPVEDVLVLLKDFDATRANPGHDAKLECAIGHTGVRAWGHMLTNKDGWACMVFDGPDPNMHKDSFLIEPDGEMSMSIDKGVFGIGRVGGEGGVSASTPTVLFPFKQLEFYETLDVRDLKYVGGINLLDQNDGFPQRWGGVTNGRATMIALDPMWQLKLIAGASGDFRLLLLNTSDDEPTGEGFGPQPDGRIPHSFFQAVKDQERLVRFRRNRMQQCGIRYPFTDDMVDRASESIKRAFAARDQHNYSAAMRELFDATTRSGTAYPLIWNVMTDTIYGLILVFILVVPFSIFLERLLFGIAILQRRLMAIFGIFVCICLILNVLHPGFEVATSPYLIPLGFVILSLVLIVLTMMMGKFDRQVQSLHDVAARVHGQDVNRMGATWTGFALGIGNMRRRRSRTTLTLLTLILLTYSLLSLTSGEISRKHFRAEFDHVPSYPGVMVRNRDWQALSEAAPEVLSTSFSHEAVLSPRCWKYAGGGQTMLIPVEYNGRSSIVYGIAGLSPEEAAVSNINREIEGGRWFEHGAGPQCMLPDNVAGELGLTEADVDEAHVRIYGRNFRLIAIYQPGRLQEFKDLDGEQISPLLPVRSQTGAAGLMQFVHLDMRDVVLASYEDMRNMGTPIMSVAMRFEEPLVGEERIKDFAARTNALSFVALDDHVEAWSYLGFVWVSGLQDLIIPLAIGALIILNTMLTAVYERAREIGIFSSVGLSPVHISTLFFAESTVFGVLGIMFGYLVGQVSANIIIKFGLATGLSLNYSSASAVFVSVLVLVLILVSTAYPARVAYKMSTPSVARSWSPPPPEGEAWQFEMPFHVPAPIAPGIAAFLCRYFDSYREASVGVFYTDASSLERAERDGRDLAVTRAHIWLAPFDAGVRQQVIVSFPRDPEDERVCDVEVRIERETGTPGDWQRMNKRFFRVLRKQFLIWRTIKQSQRVEYTEQGRELMSAASG